jgi:hypothetical protein
MLLGSKPADLHLAPTAELPHIWAALMEMPVGGNVATLAAVADGTTSMYFSTGGGIIGGSEHESVLDANRKFLLAVDKLLAGFVVKDEPLKVIPGAISFVVLTYDGMRVARDTEARLSSRASPLWPVFVLGHAVITALRQASPHATGQ